MTLHWAEAIRSEGVVRGPYAKAARPLIDDRDVAEAVVRTLLDDGHDGASYFLTGSESLTREQRAETIGAMIGRPVCYEETPREEARRMMLRTWPREPADAVLANVALQVTEPELPSPDLEHITGHPPRPFRAGGGSRRRVPLRSRSAEWSVMAGGGGVCPSGGWSRLGG
ncbi:hypothetical protein AV521_37745 [Streptomyces sp. IMTB 2501]|uniref:hypothetical protein n=1 Tax=Streptomyces sp. IMTB 2501 TaxID=1776340 RepID=UPI00096D0805|nr:hypothetical protein [Streptomyces sp. IMTB 2501]OLZ63761.1 hypothetical protein AV521_37745 [Streptomyces sp. IMTB 2501]